MPPRIIITKRLIIMSSAKTEEAQEHTAAAKEHSDLAHQHTATAHEHSQK
jgi:hypothetical protein